MGRQSIRHRDQRSGQRRSWLVVAATVGGALAVAAAPAAALLSGEVGGEADQAGHAELEVAPPEVPALPDLPELPEAPGGDSAALPDLPDLPELPDLGETPPVSAPGEGEAPELPDLAALPEVPELPVPVPGDGGGSGFPVPLPPPGDGGLPVPVPEIPVGPGTGTAVDVEVDVEATVGGRSTPPDGEGSGGPRNGGADGGGSDDGGADDGGHTDVEADARVGLDVTSEGALPPRPGGEVPELPLEGTPLEPLDPALLLLLLENPELATNPAVLEAALRQTPAGDVLDAVPAPAEEGDANAAPVLASLTGSLPEVPAGTAAPLTGTGLAGLGALGLYQLKRRFLG